MAKASLRAASSHHQTQMTIKRLTRRMPNKNLKIRWCIDKVFPLSSGNAIGDREVQKLLPQCTVRLMYSKDYTEDQILSLLTQRINLQINKGKTTKSLCQIRDLVLSRSCPIRVGALDDGYFLYIILRKKVLH